MTKTGSRKLRYFSYSLQRTSHDFENNIKMMLAVKNQSLLSWVVSQSHPVHKKGQPAPLPRDSRGVSLKSDI